MRVQNPKLPLKSLNSGFYAQIQILLLYDEHCNSHRFGPDLGHGFGYAGDLVQRVVPPFSPLSFRQE
jgi:hypothetical protein